MKRYGYILLFFAAATLAIFCFYIGFYVVNESSAPVPIPPTMRVTSPPGLLSIGTLGYSGEYEPLIEDEAGEEPGEIEVPIEEPDELSVLLQIRDTAAVILYMITLLIACGAVFVILYPLWMFSQV